MFRESMFAVAALFLTSGVTNATCRPHYAQAAQLVGKNAWLAHAAPARIPQNVNTYRGFGVPTLKQTGPSLWEADGRVLPQGSPTKVVQVVEFFATNVVSDLARYVEVEIDGTAYVVEAGRVIAFDFTNCGAADVLSDRKLPSGYRSQYLDGLPMMPKAGVRPTDYTGRWIHDRELEQLAFVDCSEFSDHSLNPKDTVLCSPVWEAGVDGYDLGRPIDLFFGHDELEQLTSLPTGKAH